MFSIGSDVKRSPDSRRIRVEQSLWCPGLDFGSLYSDRADVKIVERILKEEFLSVSAPRRIRAAIRRDPQLAFSIGEARQVRFHLSGFIRNVGHPVTVGRYAIIIQVRLRRGGLNNFHGLATAVAWHHPQRN